MADVEIVARVERRRKWSAEEKAALVAEIAAEGGKVRLVARRHRIAESLLYNWRAAWKAAASAAASPGSAEFVPLGVFHHADKAGMAMLRSPDAAQPGAGDEGVPRLPSDRYAQRLQRSGGEGAASDRPRSVQRPFVSFPWQARRLVQGDLLGRQRPVAARRTA